MNEQAPRHILVYRLSALGDVAMTIPAIYSAARHWPTVTFHVATSAFCAQLFIEAPTNIVVHPIAKPITTWRVLKQLNQLPIDAVADLHNVLRSWLVDAWFRLKGKKVRMMTKMRDERDAILHQHQSASKPFTQRYFNVFARLGLPCEPAFTSVFSEQPSLPLQLEKGQEQWIGIAPYARYDNKTYPLEQMKQVVQLLTAKADSRVFLFGSRGEQAETLAQWEQLSPRVHNVAGRYSLSEELALMAHLDTMLSMDSANMHMASLVGTRVVSVWGSTTPACGFMGWQQQSADAVLLNLDCQPCAIGGSEQCKLKTLACLRQLTPDTIVKKLYVEK